MKFRAILLFVPLLFAVTAQAADSQTSERAAREVLDALVREAPAWEASADSGQRNELAERHSKITECPVNAPTPPEGSVIYNIRGIEFALQTIETGADSWCYYLARPFSGPLSPAEARALQATTFLGKTDTPARKVVSRIAGEKLFADLREAIQSNKFAEVPELSENAASFDASLRACGPNDFDSTKEWQQRYTGFTYNAVYTWSLISEGGTSCIRMFSPISRGLTADEARDFMRATRSAMNNSGSSVNPSHTKIGVSYASEQLKRGQVLNRESS